MSKLLKLVLASLLLSIGQISSAQVLTVLGCDVENGGEFVEMVDQFWDAMSGGYRPALTLVASEVNGPSAETHAVVLEHANYEAYERWGPRIGQTPEAQLLLERNSDNMECNSQTLAIERASWGDRSSAWSWNAIYPVMTGDGETYVEAFDDMMNSDTGQSVQGAVVLYEMRAGSAYTHIVGIFSPSFTALNNDLDTLFSSDAYEDFNDEVAGIRTLGPRSQSRRVRTWEP